MYDEQFVTEYQLLRNPRCTCITLYAQVKPSIRTGNLSPTYRLPITRDTLYKTLLSQRIQLCSRRKVKKKKKKLENYVLYIRVDSREKSMIKSSKRALEPQRQMEIQVLSMR